MIKDPPSLLIVLAGLFTITGALADWDWFMEHRKSKMWVNIFGRNGTRVFYTILGAAITIGGTLLALGITQ